MQPREKLNKQLIDLVKASCKNKDIIALIKHGADVNTKLDDNGNTLLHLAALRNRLELMHKLMLLT